MSRTQLILILFAVACLSILILFPSSFALILSQLLIDGPILTAWLGACWGTGSVISLCRQGAGDASILRHVSQTAIGMGILSLLTLLLGCAGLMNQFVAMGILVAGNIILLTRFYRHQNAIKAWLGGVVTDAWPTVFAMPIIATMFVGAVVVPGILFGDEPHPYDVLAYHLQLPREWFETGRISPTPHNVFGYFPLNVEMQYLLAMTLRGGATSGMFLAQMMHATMMVLTLGAIYGTVAPRGRLNAAVAVVFAAAFPWMLMLGSVAYNECGLMLFTTLAVAWALRERWGLAGLCAGLAAGCKITAVPALIALLPAIVLIESLSRKRFEWRGIALLFLGAIVTFSPWLIRTAILTHGNPLFPIAMRTLGPGYFDEGMVERFEVAHSARADQQAVGPRLAALNDQVFKDFKYGSTSVSGVAMPVLLLLIVPAMALRYRDRKSWMLGAFVAGNVVLWLFATHLQGRFLVPIIPVAAILVLGSANRVWAAVVLVVAIFSVPISFATVQSRLMNAVPGIAIPDSTFLLPESLVKLLQSTNRPVYLLGDARAFLYPVSMNRLHYRSVFDVPSDRGFKEGWLGKSVPQDAIVIVAPSELERFEKTYRNLPPMPETWRGRGMFVTDAELKTMTPLE